MARIRTIKPEFFVSLTIASLPVEARMTFIGLWTHVDDEGRCVDDTRLIRAALWALDDRSFADVDKDLDALANASLIRRYMVSGRRYLEIKSWSEHQKINRPTKSKHPPPANADEPPPTRENVRLMEDSLSAHEGLSDDSLGERNREQGTGKGKNIRSSPPRSQVGLRSSDDDRSFSLFWGIYPRKVAKTIAINAWRKARAKVDDPAVIIAGAARYRDDPGRDPAFTANPATWLNAERWNDEPTPPSSASGHRATVGPAAIIDRDMSKYHKGFKSS